MGNNKPTRKKLDGEEKTSAVSHGRHEYHCKICSHPKREEIEQAFLTWTSPIRIAKEYGVSRDSVYRHAHTFSLVDKRRRNLHSALERIIEKAGDVEVTATAVVSAVAAYAKINANGQWVERSEHINLNELFDRMSQDEMDMRYGMVKGARLEPMAYSTKGRIHFRRLFLGHPNSSCIPAADHTGVHPKNETRT